MAHSSKHIITPKLSRQLDHIEMIGNAEAELAAQEQISSFEEFKLQQTPKHSISERQHRLDTAMEQFLRETQRTKKLGFILLALVPVTALIYFTSLFLDNTLLAMLSIPFAGVLIGFAVVVILKSKRNIKELTEAQQRA